MKRTSKIACSILAMVLSLAMLSGVFALPANAIDSEGLTAEVVRLVNTARADEDEYALASTNDRLNAAAQKRAEEIAVKFDHERPDGRSAFTALTDQGLTYGVAGENIAVGPPTPAWVVTTWMNYPETRNNILGLKAGFNAIGVGVYEQEDGMLCWALLFINDDIASAGDADVGGVNAIGSSGSANPGGGSESVFAKFENYLAGIWDSIRAIFSVFFKR